MLIKLTTEGTALHFNLWGKTGFRVRVFQENKDFEMVISKLIYRH